MLESNYTIIGNQIVTADVFGAITIQAEKPPKNETVIGACYSAIIANYEALVGLFATIVEQRNATPQHLTNLLFRALQSTLIDNQDYPQGYQTKESWQPIIEKLVKEKEFAQQIQEILINKDTTTTILARYAGLAALTKIIKRDEFFTMFDFGCGANHGLCALGGLMSFDQIDDMTEGSIINTFASQLKQGQCMGIGIDRENPYDPQAVAWRHSCSMYPSEVESGTLDRLRELDTLSIRYRDNFVEGDVTQEGFSFNGKFDFGIISTMLYQLDEPTRRRTIENALNMLNDDGILFIQDFAVVEPRNPSRLVFVENWGTKGAYRLFALIKQDANAIYELVRWGQKGGGRCEYAENGSDLLKFLSLWT